MNKDRLIIEYKNTRKLMNSISPKLQLHAQLKAELERLAKLLGDQVPE